MSARDHAVRAERCLKDADRSEWEGADEFYEIAEAVTAIALAITEPREDHDPALPPADIDAFGRIRRADR